VNSFSFKLAARVIRAADREHPADGVLRDVLRAQRELSPDERTGVSEAVFAYLRWHGWLDQTKALHDQIEHALRLVEQYSGNPRSFTDEQLMARAVPPWLATVMDVSPAWVRALQTPPRLWLRARRGEGRRLAEKLGDCVAFGQGALGDALEYRGRQDLFRTAEFHGGEFELQDLSSQAVGLICAPQPGQTWWDACAGEGGKTLHLSELMENKGLIWASDSTAWRLRRLKRRAARAGVFNYRAVGWDGGARLPTRTKFDGVLVDAPCSGIGTWQRNPHARWTVTARDVEELSERQQNLLFNVASAVKPGGKLIYAVCTLARPETLGVVAAFVARQVDFERARIGSPLDPAASPNAHVEYWPQQFGGAGMFVAAWTRRKG
jgi:16S rRNA (cytosine967-C5)-methyltransferase